MKFKYPTIKCELNYKYDYELLIAGRLSARCKDDRVNIVTKELFAKYKSLKAFANADINDVIKIIKPCGLHNVKANDVILICKMILEQWNGILPNSINQLIKLHGIGRKTANLIVGEIFNKPAVICDVHCIRISNRLGIIYTMDPGLAENMLRMVLPQEESTNFCHRLVSLGKSVCTAKITNCIMCCLNKYCKYANEHIIY